RETRRLARLRREMARRLVRVERAWLEERRRAVLDDVRRCLRATGREPRAELVCRAQGLEDCYLWQLFRPLTSGRFIEAGASDGVRNSVTWLFEAVGWTGVLVEANPDAAAACARNRPASHTVHAALGPPGAGTTTSLVRLGGFTDADHLSFVPTLARHRSEHVGRARTAERIEVPLRTMTSSLADAPGEPRYDVAVIGLEGAELAALRGFDPERFPTAVLMVEDLSGGRDPEVAQLLERQGYVCVGRVERNAVYVHRTRPDLIERSRELGWWPEDDDG